MEYQLLRESIFEKMKKTGIENILEIDYNKG